ncbi:MAG: 50S ribosomal protein L10 [Candidatus Yanofskybacteria bacterium RIFCSPHIGHO2_02_FULL_43_15c]|uniref:Large ribosomal subunit protein uL10 n=1 Tax=Candidatus Yanofskybacteria bacterium RIFCSPHIGHO2_02_FULL_43_15c TaxID=1802679 RepID=A0A1F8FHB5_9BACT|nr:MAG: 50S ribosomal protein L10 [Candidatus Yanofskybacteria bacterium RIFCSPHIGHO2_02_FULL_43_15c]
MKTKQQKKETVKDLSKKMPEAEMVVFTSYSRTGEKGLSVAKMRELKKVLRGMGAEYVVAKKNLIRIAAEQVHFGELVDVGSFDGSVGVVVGPKEGDSVALSKNVYDFAKVNPVFKVLGAILEKKYLNADSFNELAKLPSREIMLGRMLGMTQYPLTGLMNVLQGNIRNLLVLLSNLKK